MTDVKLTLLDRVEIPEPCPMSWRRMTGDSQVRFCPTCEKSVYNLSAMSRDEAEHLVRESDGHLCAQVLRRPDGRILHIPRPSSALWLRRWFMASAASIAAALNFVIGGCGFGGKICPKSAGSIVVSPTTKPDHVTEQSPTPEPSTTEPSPNTSGQSIQNPPFLWDGAETFGSKSFANE